MAIASERDLVTSQPLVDARRSQRKVLPQREIDPGSFTRGVGRVQWQIVAWRIQVGDVLAGNLAQEFPCRRKLTFGENLIRGRLVVRGLRLLHSRDRDQADFEALFRLLELAGDRGAVRVDGEETILGGQYVEVALRDADNEVLLSGFTVGFGASDLLVGATQIYDLIPTEDRLP